MTRPHAKEERPYGRQEAADAGHAGGAGPIAALTGQEFTSVRGDGEVPTTHFLGRATIW